MARALNKPILRLVEGTQAIAAGDLTSRIDIESNDEIGKLAKSFNNMTKDLQNTYNALQKEISAHKQAEEMLEEINDQLEQAVENAIKKLERT